jgi:hypothetical protein
VESPDGSLALKGPNGQLTTFASPFELKTGVCPQALLRQPEAFR